MNNFSKLLLIVLTILLIFIYFQNVSLKREIESLKNKIDEIKISQLPSPSFEEEQKEKVFEKKAREEVIYVGNSKTLKFHLPDCRWAKKINPANIVYFNSKEEALKKGYKPCKICNP